MRRAMSNRTRGCKRQPKAEQLSAAQCSVFSCRRQRRMWPTAHRLTQRSVSTTQRAKHKPVAARRPQSVSGGTGRVPSLKRELESTPTARWYRDVRYGEHERGWPDRVRCYTALSAILADYQVSAIPGRRRDQPPVSVPGVLTKVAHRAHFASAEPVYRRWRAGHDEKPASRWAGPDPAVKPGPAFVAEAKIVSFWAYRHSAITVADEFDMTPTEMAAAYLRALAAWAIDHAALAAYRPAGPPGCVSEDMTILAARCRRQDGGTSLSCRARRLTGMASDVVGCVMADLSLTPQAAFGTVQGEVLELVAGPPGSLTDQAAQTLAALSDRLLHLGDARSGVPAGEVDLLLAALRKLGSLRASTGTCSA